MKRNSRVQFLYDMAEWFDKQAAITKEDREYWAYLFNAQNCRDIAIYLEEEDNVQD